MSTNFYAHFTLGGGHHSDQSLVYKMHIGKRSSKGLSTISGVHFPDVDSWVKFLRHNANAIKVVDEYGTDQDIEAFIEEELLGNPESSKQQIERLRTHDGLLGPHIIHDEPQPTTWEPKNWIDQATGKLFYSGEFS